MKKRSEPHPKIKESHLRRPAYIYIRQSTMNQVRHNLESTERQYALRDRALDLGWSPSMIRVLDADLGKSGARAEGRDDFKTLMADVSMGQVGAVFALEASRLARSQQDWMRLIEICALTGTLVIDEDGCYDSADFNDELLLALKAMMARTELHFIRERCWGGRVNKAKKGELHVPLPIGYRYDDVGRVVIDPDREVEAAVRLLFQVFRERGSAIGVVHEFRERGLLFPRRRHGGPWEEDLRWGHLNVTRVCNAIHNPVYAGAFVFGRRRTQRVLTEDGRTRTRVEVVPMDSWMVTIRDHHEGYVTWEDHLENVKTLEANLRASLDAGTVSRPDRGSALLQGLLICGACGHRMTVQYSGNDGTHPVYVCSQRMNAGLSAHACMAIGTRHIEEVIALRALEVMKPNEIALAMEAISELERRDEATARQWQMRIERAAYEADLAERRYREVDPSNRLVAATLEKRWNEALLTVDETKKEFYEFQKRQLRVATMEEREKALALAANFPQIWRSRSTPMKERKRMLRLLIKDITVVKERGSKEVTLHVRWQGGAHEEISVTLPPHVSQQLRIPEDVLERIRDLARTHTDDEIATILRSEGIRGGVTSPMSAKRIRHIRRRFGLRREDRRPGELTVDELAERLDLSRQVVLGWVQSQIVPARQGHSRGHPFYVTLTPGQEEELRTLARQIARPWQRKQAK